MRVFISWSGKRSQSIAEVLRDWLKDVLRDGIEPFMSSKDIYKGDKWLESITRELDISTFGIICVTPENLYSSWLMFESGALSKSLAKNSSSVCPFLFGIEKSSMSGPISQFQGVEYKKEDVRSLVTSLNKRMNPPIDEKRLNKDFDAWWPRLEEQILPIKESEEFKNLCYVESVKKRLGQALSSNNIGSALVDNKYFSKVIIDSISDFSSRIFNACNETQEISLPYISYPSRLIKLLKEYKVTVKALALIDVEEKFWRDKTGLEILRNTDKNSTRIFVFQTRKQMMETIPILYKHAERYNVGVISYDRLVREWPDYAYDFSIIGDIGTRLLARYETPTADTLETNIRFITNKPDISQHEDIINEIIQKSYFIDSSKEAEYQIEKTFSQSKGKSFEKKSIEMSAYISIPQYDQFEEQHAYYIEMMDKMLEIYEINRSGDSSVLELGAGTGLFTKRLAKKQRTLITAVEIDWACFTQLEHKIKLIMGESKDKNIIPINADSRDYQNPGKFDFIFSSFSDHHIKPYDKNQYFSNMFKNLKSNGYAIIGDEFLPTYDRSNVEARREALKKYHNHIINIANERKQTEMAELEEAALKSGLEEIGDFKISCDEYEDLLIESGFRFTKEKIGPKQELGVGGIYVYTLSKRDST